MKLLSRVLLLVVMLASQKSQGFELTVEPTPETEYVEYLYDDITVFDYYTGSYVEDIPEPNITMYWPMEDIENVIVMCKFGKTHNSQSFNLSVESELNYTMEMLKCSSSDSLEICVYMVTVSPPASFTCVHECGFGLDVRNLRSQTYNYSGSVLDHHEVVSLFYICFSSFIVVGLFIMTAVVVITNIRSKAKDPINPTAVTNNDYMEA